MDLWRQPELRLPIGVCHVNVDPRLLTGEEVKPKGAFPENRRRHGLTLHKAGRENHPPVADDPATGSEGTARVRRGADGRGRGRFERRGGETRRRIADWVPDRQEVNWIDCNPQVGREMRDQHPYLVLSPRAFNARTSLVIGLPLTTAPYNADNPFAVVAGMTGGARASKTCQVLCHQPQSFDRRVREAAPHPLGHLPDAPLEAVRVVLNLILAPS